jgi:predicted RecB family nuclease
MRPDQVTAEEVIAHFECRTKAALLSQSIAPHETDIAFDLYNKYGPAAHAALEQATHSKLIEFHQLSRQLPFGDHTYLIDSRSTLIERAHLNLLLNRNTARGSRDTRFSPVFFCPFDRPQPWHTTVLYFAALAIEHATGLIPVTGYLCFAAPAPSIKSVRLSRIDQHLDSLRQIATACRAEQSPRIELNAHCPICQYRSHCRKKAIEEDSLTLVSSIPPKERRKLFAKGITTITQLSYTYRPRRKRRAHATPRPAQSLITNKNDNRLKALAIRKKQVHILRGEPTIAEGTPVYLDVEGLIGTNEYYLVGMRFRVEDEWIERSFWANARTEERDVWREFFKTLMGIDKPQLVHYGSYESTYITHMKQRYPDTIKNHKIFDAIMSRSRNLLKTIYGSIYFPTYTNGLKDVAGYLGFTWSDPLLTGSWASMLRLHWEVAPNEETKQMLVRYNIEDCRAAQVVANAIDGFQREISEGTRSTSNLVDINELRVPYQRAYGPFASTSPDFHRINSAAYWDYQRERVFVRSNQTVLAKRPRSESRPRGAPPRPDKVIYVERAPPARCRKCRRRRIWKAGCQNRH